MVLVLFLAGFPCSEGDACALLRLGIPSGGVGRCLPLTYPALAPRKAAFQVSLGQILQPNDTSAITQLMVGGKKRPLYTSRLLFLTISPVGKMFIHFSVSLPE